MSRTHQYKKIILALLLRSSSGLVIFLYWWVRDMGTSESAPEQGEVDIVMLPPGFCSGDESVEEPAESRVVELTLGEKAENGDCQFMLLTSSCDVSLWGHNRV